MASQAETEHFVDIRQFQPGIPLNGDKPMFGKSPIEFTTAEGTKPTRKITEMLKEAKRVGILHADTTIGDRGLTHTMNGMSFVEIKLPAPDSEMGYYVHARVLAPDGKGSHQYTTAAQLKNIGRPSITVISGPCLFSAPAVRATDTGGTEHFLTDPSALDGITQKIVSITVNPRLQPYEADSVLKSTGIMRSLNTDGKQVTIGLNVPRIEYWFYALDVYENGLIETPLLLRWFDEVEVRANRLEQLMAARAPNGTRVGHINPLDKARDMVRSLVEDEERNIFRKVIKFLVRSDDEWKYAVEATDPHRFVDLGYLSYTIAHLKTAMQEDTLPIIIENPEETKIMDRAQALLAEVAPHAVVFGMFPHSNATMREDPGNGRRMLYFFPTREPKNHRGAMAEVIKTHRKPVNGVIYENGH